jgi:WD40 repeat protein
VETVARLLMRFGVARLIREVQEEELCRYELMHEYLIEQINQITGKVLDATQRANRLLRQYLTDYGLDNSTRIPRAKLWFIRRHANMERGGRGHELLRKSLRWGLLKASALAILLLAGSVLAAATLSVSDEWDDMRLSDGHTAAARRAVFSPDGQLLVSVGEDAKVIVWDFARRKRLATLAGHTAAITALAFSPDGKWLVTGEDEKAVRLWAVNPLREVAVVGWHAARIKSVAFSPEGQQVASAGDDKVIALWDVQCRSLITRIGTHAAPVLSVAFSPDGQHLVAGEHDRSVRVYTSHRFLWGYSLDRFPFFGKH